MGRSCKKIKAKLSEEEESRNLIIYKTDDLISNQIINDIIGQSSNQTFHFPKKFKYWLNAQFETIRSNEYLSNRFNFKQNETIKFDLSVEINDLFLMSVLKDKVYQIYKQHIKESLLINETKKRLKNNDYIDSSAENVTQDDLLAGIISDLTENAKWLTNFTLNLPGFNKLEEEDFMKIVNHATAMTYGLQLNEFYYNNEFHHIIKNGYQLSQNRLNLAFGSFGAYLFIIAHAKFKELDLSENEISLLYPAFLYSCDGILLIFQYFYTFKIN